jgi:hypothetical protein
MRIIEITSHHATSFCKFIKKTALVLNIAKALLYMLFINARIIQFSQEQ